ncbi:hypothetical protein EDD93_3705 [Streptomyces sp. 840.1]|uniref:hypothetical protein n=1 Tax=Streptomyces sp. 840.1 TaxID=2485152 RepID=UPI000F472487|nr:hypothetical protein [Streptomyces sp. 840.1]ROQ69208.1 hypothetical protein EDD93_3705 [Streptomyces sp. 840.1]
MFGRKQRRITELEQLAAGRAARIAELEDEARGLRYSSRHNAQLADRLTGRDEDRSRAHVLAVIGQARTVARLHRALRACARYRDHEARLVGRLALLQAAYDTAVGLDDPALHLGVHWQERRSDKPRPTAVVKP